MNIMPKYYLLLFAYLWPVLIIGQNNSAKSQQENFKVHIKKTAEKIVLDGQLNEACWAESDVAKDFWMSFPTDGVQVPKEIQTEVRMTYDDNFIYFGAICYGPNDYIIPTLRRDSRELWRGDIFGVFIDPVNEATNGFSFVTNPAGVQMETLVSGRTGTRAEMNARTGNTSLNTAWDNKWYVEVQKGTDRWTVEIAIPFKTLRFDPKKPTWGLNFSRGEPRTNAWHSWSPVPRQFLTLDLGYTGALVWDTPPKKVKGNIAAIPYVLGSATRDFEEDIPTEIGGRVGGDAKIAINSGLNLDITVNPDFSQVDVDEQVTNLNTFNIRFPERRLFFLENSDLFSDFGIPPIRPFFSRRIGLDEDGGTIPILYGARLSGNLNKDLRIGAMNLQTDKKDDFLGQNYTSIALHQRLLGRSVIKGYFHNRQAMNEGELIGDDYNRTAGMEFRYFSRDAKWQGLGSYGLSQSDGLKGDNYFYTVGGGYDGTNLSFYTNLAGVGDNYYADMGWVPFAEHYDAVRDTSIHVGYQHTYTRLSYTIYPENSKKINFHQFTGQHIWFGDNANWGLLQNIASAEYLISFSNASGIGLNYTHQDNRLLYPFDFTDEEPLPAGRYHFDFMNLTYQSDTRKLFNLRGSLQYGSFFLGERFQGTMVFGYRIQPWGNFSLNFTYNNLQFPDPYGNEDLILIGPRIGLNFTRNLFWTTFLQFNTQSDNFNINSRLQWRFLPMSDLFVVYSDNYAIEVWGEKDRTLVLKLNYWLNL